MSTKAGTLEAERSSGLGLREWIMAAIAAVALTALVMSFLALRHSAPIATTQRPVADVSVYERSQPVTGTGPALVWFADSQGLSGIYERSQPVTGTGPGLERLGDAGIYQRSQPVTGTGPDLSRIAGR